MLLFGPLSATALSSGGSISYAQAVAATCGPAGTMVRAASKRLATTASPAATLRRGAEHVLAAQTVPAATLLRAATARLTAIPGPLAALDRRLDRILAAASAPTAIVNRAASVTMPLSSTVASALIRAGTKTLSTSGGPLTMLARGTAHDILAQTIPASTVTRGATKLIYAEHGNVVSGLVPGIVVVPHMQINRDQPVDAVINVGTSSVRNGTKLLFPYYGDLSDGSFGPFSSGPLSSGGTISGPSVAVVLNRTIGLTPNASSQPESRLIRALNKRLAVIVSTVIALAKAATSGLSAATDLTVTLGKGTQRAVTAQTVPAATLHPALALLLRALSAVAPGLVTRFFEIPSNCNILTAATQERILVIDTCDPKTYEFPARYTPESMLYGVNLAHRLGVGELIVAPAVDLMNGDLVVSDVLTDGTLITFRLSGGSAVYQRLAIQGVTNATPANTIQIEATIACYP